MLITLCCYLPFPPPSRSFTPFVRAHSQVSALGGLREAWNRKEANPTTGVPVHQHLLGSPIVSWANQVVGGMSDSFPQIQGNPWTKSPLNYS